MEIIYLLLLVGAGGLVWKTVISRFSNPGKESEEAKVLDFKQREVSQSVETLKKLLAEQKTGQELTEKEVEAYWNSKDSKE